MCNNEMNLPLFIIVKSPYFTGRVDLSYFKHRGAYAVQHIRYHFLGLST
jgi:hypothetical protein